MAQLTLYLDDELETRLRAAARAANLSQSRWVANLIAEKLNDEWPASVVALAGAWSDFPEANELRSGLSEDAARESL
jgi:predicted transcriptional regulator